MCAVPSVCRAGSPLTAWVLLKQKALMLCKRNVCAFWRILSILFRILSKATTSPCVWQRHTLLYTLTEGWMFPSDMWYLIPHQGSYVAGLSSRSGAHIQNSLSRTRPEHVTHNHGGEVLHVWFEEWSLTQFPSKSQLLVKFKNTCRKARLGRTPSNEGLWYRGATIRIPIPLEHTVTITVWLSFAYYNRWLISSHLR